jgi:hypothetical protein
MQGAMLSILSFRHLLGNLEHIPMGKGDYCLPKNIEFTLYICELYGM